MQPISRRNVLLLGGVGTAGVLVGGAGLISGWASGFDPTTGRKLAEPKALRTVGGRLQVRLTAAAGSVRIGGQNATALSYNGGIPGPTLFLHPGTCCGSLWITG